MGKDANKTKGISDAEKDDTTVAFTDTDDKGIAAKPKADVAEAKADTEAQADAAEAQAAGEPASETAPHSKYGRANAFHPGAARPAESMIRGSFMPGGGPGEDAHTEVDQETHAQYPTHLSEDGKKAAIAQAREDAQAKYRADVANPDIPMVEVPAGADTTNPAPTQG